METALNIFRRLLIIVGLIVLAIYGIYWLMFLPYILMALTTPKGWMLWVDGSGPDGIAGPIFLWFLVLMNPATVIYLLTKVRNRANNKTVGVPHVDL
ncbi:MAG: hypothetical protein ACKOQM_04960 [Novosphingobium sp.]